MRTREELAAVFARDPFAGEGVAEKLYQVTFLDREPPDGLAEQVAAFAVGGERFVAHGREWYVYHAAGIARSKLATKIAAKNLGVLVTARNWTTVRALLELADGDRWTASALMPDYVVLDVFTDTPLQGNQLAVFIDGRGLDRADAARGPGAQPVRDGVPAPR